MNKSYIATGLCVKCRVEEKPHICDSDLISRDHGATRAGAELKQDGMEDADTAN